MASTAIVGVNWGDEGKGRMVDLLTEAFAVVVSRAAPTPAMSSLTSSASLTCICFLPASAGPAWSTFWATALRWIRKPW